MNTKISFANGIDTKHLLGFIFLYSLIFCISIAATIYFSVSMSGKMDMPGGWAMSMMWMRMPGQTWAASAAMFLAMWESMMVAMMLPSIIPMLFSYYRAQCNTGATTARLSTLVVAIGYFFIWLLIGALLFVPGMAFAQATMDSQDLSRLVPALSGLALIIAGSIQFTSWKMRELRRCRDLQACAPMRIFGKSRTAWRVGLIEGISCAICTSGLMLILLTLGAMSLVMMAIIAVMVALEKLLPKPNLIVKISGFAAIGAGLFMLARLFF